MLNGYAFCWNKWVFDKTIKDELGLLIIISSLSAKEGYCYASNDYLANIMECRPETISRKLKKLEDKKYITIDYKWNGARVINRKIRITDLPLTKMSTAIDKNVNRTVDKNVKDININNININNNKKSNFKNRNYDDDYLNNFYE